MKLTLEEIRKNNRRAQENRFLHEENYIYGTSFKDDPAIKQADQFLEKYRNYT